MLRGVLFSLLFFMSLPVFGQGLPIFKKYDSRTYENHRQNWSIVEDSTGYMFFGNGTGLMKFDGKRWSSIHLPKSNILRSFLRSGNDIYIGSIGEFGRLSSDSLNRFSYRSLSEQLGEETFFSDVWKIGKDGDKIVFGTYEAFFTYNGDTVEVIETGGKILDMVRLSDRILFRHEDKGKYVLQDGTIQPYESDDYISRLRPRVAVSREGTDYIFTSEGKVIVNSDKPKLLDTELEHYFNEHKVYRATFINDDEIALATLGGGIVIMTTGGKQAGIFTEKEGLPTDQIFDVYLDKEGTLWAVTDDGIVKMLVNIPVEKYDARNGFEGIPTAMLKSAGHIFVGSTEGLFQIDKEGVLQRIGVNRFRVFDLEEGMGGLLVSTYEGVFLYREGSLSKITDNIYTGFGRGSGGNELFAMRGGTVFRLQAENGSLSEEIVVEQEAPVSDLFIDSAFIWALSGSEGVSQYSREGTLVEHLTVGEGDHSDLRYEILDIISGNLRLGTTKGLYVYDNISHRFKSDSTFGKGEMAAKQVNHFRQCSDGNIWFRNNRKIKRAYSTGDHWEIREDPYRLIDEGEGITGIICGDNGTVWFGGTMGIYQLKDPGWTYRTDFNTNITGLLVRNDSLIYGGQGEPANQPKLSYSDNELRFTYTAASYIAPEENMYRVRLKGYDDRWSQWTYETEKDYTFIPEGSYTFEVQGRNVYHKAGSVDAFRFTVLPPWYRTAWAYLAYVLLAGSLIYSIYRFRINHILREHRVRNRIASDLHDEVSATLSSISYFAQAIRQSENNGKERFVRLISESANEAKEKITDIIWSIDPENDDWEILLAKCRRFASDLLESKGMEYELFIDSSVSAPIRLEMRQHLWLIFKEMITNAARHSEATKVDVSITVTAGKLVMKVQDNGTGFDPDGKKEGYGVRNIRERARKIGGELSLETDREIGTRWVLKVTL